MRSTIAFWFSAKYHPLHNFASRQISAHDLNHSHIVDIEIFGIRGHDGAGSFSHEISKDVFMAVLFRRNSRLEGGSKGIMGKGRW